jgi:hypothetical protein
MLRDALSHVGYSLELLGLAVAAFGMWRSWKVNAQGAVFWPAWMRAAYFKVVRLWGRKPRPMAGGPSSGVMQVAEEGDTAGAFGRVSSPDATMDERIYRLEVDVDRLRTESEKLTGQQQALGRALHGAVESLRSEITSAQQAIERQLSAQTVADLRPAAFGVALAAFGLLLQWIGTF